MCKSTDLKNQIGISIDRHPTEFFLNFFRSFQISSDRQKNHHRLPASWLPGLQYFHYGGNFSAVIFIEMISEQPAQYFQLLHKRI
jgi:hypothetical protein